VSTSDVLVSRTLISYPENMKVEIEYNLTLQQVFVS
jgi:hypothetical protein